MKPITHVLCTTIAVSLFTATAWAAPTDDPAVQKREMNQEQRIQQGIRSGALTPRETGRLEAQQAKIQQDEARMKSDGKLTKAERKRLKHEQDRASNDIYRKKHNDRAVSVK